MSNLNLAMVISADAKGVAPGTAEARREIEATGKAARDASTTSATSSAASADAARKAASAHQIAASAADGRSRSERDLLRAAQAATTATALQSHEVTNLTRQFSDLGVMLAGGQSPLMAMITQGPQIADIFGQRGLRSILAGVVQGITSMINPVTLTLTAITGLGYAAGWAFDAIRGGVDDANLTVEEHAELIARVAKRWGDALPGLKAYNDELRRTKDIEEALKAGRALVQEQYAPVIEQLPQLQVTLGDILPIFQSQGAESDAVGRFIDAYDELEKKIANGTATGRDAIEVQKALTAANVYGNGILADYAQQFRDYAEAIDKASKAADKFRLPPQINDRFLLGGNNRDGTPRSAILSPINTLNGFGRTPFQTADEIQLDRQRRAEHEAENKRLGALVPTPTRRPNLEDSLPSMQASITTQREQLELLRLERQLVGSNTAERELAIAALQAEQDIRRAGIDATSDEAQNYRDNAKALAEVREELQRVETAYNRAQRAGESMIDGVLGRLIDGDLKGALEGAVKDALKFAAGLQGNDIKNGIDGGNRPTAESYDGWLGAFGSLVGLGGKPSAPRPLAPAGGTVAPWSFSAPIEAVTRAALAPIGSAASSVQAGLRYVNDAATRNMALTSSLEGKIRDAVGAVYGGDAYATVYSGGQPRIGSGLPRVGSTRHDLGHAGDLRIFDANGRQIVGDGLAPLAQYWQAKNYGGTGLEMRGGGIHLDEHTDRARFWDYSSQRGSITASQRAAVLAGQAGQMPEQALARLTRTSDTATAALEKMASQSTGAAQGIGGLGGVLQKIISGINGGPGWSLTNLFGLGLSNTGAGFNPTAGGFGQMLGLRGFATGTDFAPGGWAKIFEQGGEIVDLPQGSRVIPHDVSMAMARAPQPAAQINVSRTIHNNARVEVTEDDRDDGQGGIRTDIYIDRLVAKKAATSGSGIDKALRSRGSALGRPKR